MTTPTASERLPIDQPITPLLPDSGKPMCDQIEDLFQLHGHPRPKDRLRDELVVLMMWARYGERTTARTSNPVPASEERDEVTEDAIRGAAIALVRKNGWKPGDRPGLHSVIELMVQLGHEARKISDRCAYPECGCDRDAICNVALAKADAILTQPSPPPWAEREAIAEIIRDHMPMFCGMNCEREMGRQDEIDASLEAADAVLAALPSPGRPILSITDRAQRRERALEIWKATPGSSSPRISDSLLSDIIEIALDDFAKTYKCARGYAIDPIYVKALRHDVLIAIEAAAKANPNDQ